MKTTIPTPASDLKRGDQVRWLGEVRTVRAVRPSLGCGHIVTFANGLTASWNGSWGKVVDVDDDVLARILRPTFAELRRPIKTYPSFDRAGQPIRVTVPDDEEDN